MIQLTVRILLACVFAVAAVSKLADRAGSRRAMIDFGVPVGLAAPSAALLVTGEAAVAALLVPATTARLGAVGGLILLGAFTAGITYNLVRGRQPDCHCFGQLHSEPVGWRTLARNAALATAAVVIVVFGAGRTVPSLFSDLSGFEWAVVIVGVALALAVGFQSWLLVRLMHQNGSLSLRLRALEESASGGADQPRQPEPVAPPRGLPVGSAAPKFSLPTLSGDRVSLDDLLSSGRRLLLVFSDPACGSCAQLLPDIVRWQDDLAAELAVAVVSRGTVQANSSKLGDHAVEHVLLQKDMEVALSFEVVATPMAVVVDRSGTIATSVAAGADEIRQLVASAVDAASPPSHAHHSHHLPELAVGDPAPEVSLLDLEGNTTSLEQMQGRELLVMFWDPGCGYCQRILPELVEQQADLPPDAPELVVVTRGTPEAVRSQGITGTVLLDPGFTVAPRFGARGTPTAVLVDAEGRIASELAVGAITAMDLVRGSRPAATSSALRERSVPGRARSASSVIDTHRHVE